MSKERSNVHPQKQVKAKAMTVEAKMLKRDTYVFSKIQGTLKCKERGLEIKSASFGATKPGNKVKTYKVPFTENQALEICNEFNHAIIRR